MTHVEDGIGHDGLLAGTFDLLALVKLRVTTLISDKLRLFQLMAKGTIAVPHLGVLQKLLLLGPLTGCRGP